MSDAKPLAQNAYSPIIITRALGPYILIYDSLPIRCWNIKASHFMS